MGKQISISVVENGKQLLELTTLRSTSEEYTVWLTTKVYKKFNNSLSSRWTGLGHPYVPRR